MAYQVRIADAIRSLNDNANYTVTENNVDKIWWNPDTTPISKEDILAEQTRLQEIEDNK
jgi:hypothetical protein